MGWFSKFTKSIGGGIANIFAPVTGFANQTIATVANSQLGTQIGGALVSSGGGGWSSILGGLFGQTQNTGVTGGMYPPGTQLSSVPINWKNILMWGGGIALFIGLFYWISKKIK